VDRQNEQEGNATRCRRVRLLYITVVLCILSGGVTKMYETVVTYKYVGSSDGDSNSKREAEAYVYDLL